MTPLDYRAYWEAGEAWPDWLSGVAKHEELWRGVAARVRVPPQLVERVEALAGRWRLLVLTEDWCGDAVNLVPPIAGLALQASNLDARMIGRDDNPALMAAHLTRGTRSIPVAIVLDERFRMRGWWGPRPGPVQDWFEAELRAMPSRERYPLLRGWYARDRGATTLHELVAVIEAAAAAEAVEA